MSEELIKQYAEIHSSQMYGQGGMKKAHYILSQLYRVKCDSVIDYGCGRSKLPELLVQLGIPSVTRYDPAIPEYSAKPIERHDVLISLDVLEHLPEEEIDDALADMKRLSRHAIFVINTRLAKTILPDGRNAHLTVKPAEWWLAKLQQHWPEAERFRMEPSYQAAFKSWKTSRLESLIILGSKQWHRTNRNNYYRKVL